MFEIVESGTSTLAISGNHFVDIAAVADYHAAGNVFADFMSRKAANTLRAHQFDLATFAEFLDAAHGITPTLPPTEQRQAWLAKGKEFQTVPAAWAGITWGVCQAFVAWQLKQGAAIGSLNRRLATVKVYAKLATKAGVIDSQAYALIRLVVGYGGAEAKRVDAARPKTRTSTKKAVNTQISDAQAKALKTQPDTPQGRRDALIMAVLLDLGLRAGELKLLEVSHVNLKAATITFYRPKVDMTQTHDLSKDCLVALRNWFDSGDCAPFGPLLRGSRKGGYLTDCGMSTTSISERVRSLGKELGIAGLSAHDCRHYWATHHARRGTPTLQLMQAGGWKSTEMIQRYVDAAEIANKGMV